MAARNDLALAELRLADSRAFDAAYIEWLAADLDVTMAIAPSS
jgi:hypothetical protein